MKSNLKTTLMFFFLVWFSVQNFAQDRNVSGTVTSAENGETLIGVNVLIKDSSTGTVTDFNGNYSINAPDGTVLTFSYTGFATQEIAVNGQSTVDVQMSQGLQLDEVVVTALGISRERKALGYSVEKIDADDIAKSGQTNIVSSLQGRISGVNVQSGSGAPGAGVDITIRGFNSLDPSRSNTPLFIIDGVQVSNSTDSPNVLPSSGPLDNNSRQQASNSNRAVDINPDDIESMTILKGAAATALYGARAANGAVIITTKKGKSGKTQISINASAGFQNVLKTPKIQTTYRDGRRGAVRFLGDGTHWYFQSQGPKVYDGQPTVIRDFYDDFYQRGTSSSIGASVSGGTDKATYYISANDFSSKGIIRSAEYDRKNLRFGGELALNDKIKVRSSLAYTNSSGNQIHEGQKSVISSLSFMNNSLDLNDYLNEDGSQKNPFLFIIDQPFYLLDVTWNRNNVDRYIGNVGVNYKINDNISLDYTLGADLYTDQRERFVPPGLDLSSQVNGFIYEQRISSRQVTSLINLNLQKQLNDDFTLSGVIGNEVFTQNKDILNVRGEDFSFSDFPHVSNAAQIKSTNSISEQATIGAFAQVELGYSNSLYLTLTGRNDWSSTLPKDSRSYFYPSASLAWVITDMVDMPEAISLLKLRGSWAKVGKAALPYNDGIYFAQASNFPFNDINGFNQQSAVGSPDLRPEFTKSTEFGIEFNLFKKLIAFEASYYKDRSEDLLMDIPVSNATGASRIYTNAGTIENKGIELLLNLQLINRSNFFWHTGFNWFKNDGDVISVNNDLGFIDLYDNPGRARGMTARFQEGGKIGDIYGHDFRYSPDGDMIVGEDGFPIVDNDEKYLLGNAVPKFVANWNNTLGYKGLELSFLWEWKNGGDAFDMGRRNGIRNGLLIETERRYEEVIVNGVVEMLDGDGNVTGYETNTTPIEWEPERLERSSGRYNNAGSVLLEDASWIRLRNINLSYRLPKSMLENIFISGVKLSITANNVYLNTPFKGYDPETNYFGSGSNILGFTGLKTPATRSFLGSIRLTF